jgi:hypothetical protein
LASNTDRCDGLSWQRAPPDLVETDLLLMNCGSGPLIPAANRSELRQDGHICVGRRLARNDPGIDGMRDCL